MEEKTRKKPIRGRDSIKGMNMYSYYRTLVKFRKVFEKDGYSPFENYEEIVHIIMLNGIKRINDRYGKK